MNPIEQNAAKTKTKRKYKLTPTARQRRVARIAADVAMGKAPHIKSNGQIIAAAGFGTGLQTQPKRVLNSVGVKMALEELGFNPETAKQVVFKILTDEKAKHSDRLKASEMVFKVHGTYAAEKSINVNVDVESSNDRLSELAARLRNSV